MHRKLRWIRAAGRIIIASLIFVHCQTPRADNQPTFVKHSQPKHIGRLAAPLKVNWPLLGSLILLTLVFAFTHGQHPLYSSNQNTYFLHGLADAGMGALHNDWLAQTADPFPLFSALVRYSYQYCGAWFFYALYSALLALYCFTMLFIAHFQFKISWRSQSFYLLALMWVLFHSASYSYLTGHGLAMAVDLNPTVGLAGQYVLGPVLQPSVFGIFLLVSIAFYVRQARVYALLCLAVAVAMHSSYLLSAVSLALVYCFDFYTTKGGRSAAAYAALASLLFAPGLIYAVLNFGPSSAVTFSEAQQILLEQRIPHHADPRHWFGWDDVAKLILILSATAVLRRTRLFAVLALPLGIGALLTLVQVVTASTSLALLFPWRVSAFLTPLALLILLSRLVLFAKSKASALKRLRAPRLTIAIAVLFLLLIAHNAVITAKRFERARKDPAAALYSFVKRHMQATDVYLIPPGLEDFRLQSGAAIVVDYKSHPYRDKELIDWWERLRRVRGFYDNEDPSEAAILLRTIAREYSATHYVVPSDASMTLPGYEVLFNDGHYTLLQRARKSEE